ncbi:hypothetical protein [Blastococcus mobilis]|uniref:Uncharacterized protein n=1 Tax=Blastococcus mobilis TaxID=1938746 RepID=A0A238XCR8_9ACTN|nr:hypothetical protein [Blastococcus mobilis]SNR56114.1 hypothetical protein SAMN06272737_112135 [Blastococcus mobilis]
MRNDAADVLDRLRDSRDPRLLRLIDDALRADTVTPPDPDVVEPYRWFLARVGDGLKLTAAGYLPPAVVSEIMRRFGWDADWVGAGNREDLTVPVSALRTSARRLGLVRVHRGVLLQSVAGRRLAEDPDGLWQHIAARLPLGSRDVELQAGVLWLLAIAARRPDPEHVVALGLRALGWVGGTGDRRTRQTPVRSSATRRRCSTGSVSLPVAVCPGSSNRRSRWPVRRCSAPRSNPRLPHRRATVSPSSSPSRSPTSTLRCGGGSRCPGR